MFGFGGHKSKELDYIRLHAVAMGDKFNEYIEAGLDLEDMEFEGFLNGIEILISGPARMIKVLADRNKPLNELLPSLSKKKKYEIADMVVAHGGASDQGNPADLESLTNYVVAIALYQSAGEELVSSDSFNLVMSVIAQAEKAGARARKELGLDE